jgi:ferric-dicitrate binding protein FerR (iron transport regulator)
MTTNELQLLLDQYLADTLDAAGLERLRNWVQTNDSPQQLDPLIQQVLAEHRYTEQMPGNRQLLFEAMLGQAREREAAIAPVRSLSSWKRWTAAAAVLLVLITATWLWRAGKQMTDDRSQMTGKNTILPGGNKATLTLADGRIIILDSTDNGTIATQNGIKVIKLNNGQLAYQSDIRDPTSDIRDRRLNISYNTLTTPRGGQYQLTLPDGSKVWLNAASSIQYPTVFTGKERKVMLTGEAYFEIAQNPASPFKVNTPTQEVEVLGTDFNINAYTDEPVIKTTLLQGSVKVTPVISPLSSVILKKGQQAQLNAGAHPGLVVVEADTEQAVAWKNGLFSFEGAGLEQVMRQLSRWYDVEVQYEGKIPAFTFGGKIQRNLALADLLVILQRAEVKFRIEQGRKLVVTQ